MGLPPRLFLLPLALIALGPARAHGQAATASVTVTVTDGSGARVGDLAVDLAGAGRTAHATTDARGRATFLLLRPGTYALGTGGRLASANVARLELSIGPASHQDVRVVLPGPGETPRVSVRIDGEATGRTFAGPALTDAPRPSDPWSLLRDVPGIVIDRVDVGGSETAQQSLVLSRGDPGTGVTWTLDGVDITDPAAVGATSVYPDADGLDFVAVRTSTLDARVRTPGVQVGLFAREPADALAGRAHFRSTGFPSDNLPEALAGRPFFRNLARRGLDAGADLGGALLHDRAWGWAGFGRDSLRQDTFTEHEERLSVTWFAAKARLRTGSGETSLLVLRSDKVDEDRDPTTSASPEARWRQSGPTHLVALEDRRSLGPFSLLAHASLLDAGFRLQPQGGTANDAYEDIRGVVQRSYESFETERPRTQVGVETAVVARVLGLDHRLSAGAGYRRSVVSTRARWPGTQVLAFERQTVFFRTFALTGFALPTRGQSARSAQDEREAWAQDEARRGRLSASLGLRFDRLAGHNLPSSVEANGAFPRLLPAASYAGGPTTIAWVDVLPRAGLAWDATRDGRTVARSSYGEYSAPMSAGDVTFDNPIGREPASLTYYWIDRNGDHTVQAGELDLVRGLLGASGVDPGAPATARSPNRIDGELRAPRTREATIGLEHAFGTFLRAEARGSWRRLDRALWRPLLGLTLADYVVRGAVTGDLFDRAYNVAYFAPASTSRIVAGNGRLLANREGYHQDTWTAEVVATGTAGRHGGWEAWASATDWREFFTDSTRAVQDPTPTEGEPLQDAGVLAVRAGGLGRTDLFVNARWTAGATVRAWMPLALEAALRVHVRDGFPVPYFKVADTGDPTAPAKNVLVAPHLDSYRLPTLFLVDARLARGLTWRGGRVTAAVDVFNLLNRSTTLQVARDVELPAFDRPREIVRPRIWRFGLEYRFGPGARGYRTPPR